VIPDCGDVDVAPEFGDDGFPVPLDGDELGDEELEGVLDVGFACASSNNKTEATIAVVNHRPRRILISPSLFVPKTDTSRRRATPPFSKDLGNTEAVPRPLRLCPDDPKCLTQSLRGLALSARSSGISMKFVKVHFCAVREPPVSKAYITRGLYCYDHAPGIIAALPQQ
jgi:hypothetical protein